MAELESPALVYEYLRQAVASLRQAHMAASEREGNQGNLNGPIRDMIFGLNTAVDTLAQMVEAHMVEGETVAVATQRWHDGDRPVKGGIYGGKVWHYRSTKWTGTKYLTACGKIFEPRWRPGYRNLNPKTCAKCEKVWNDTIGQS